MYLVDIKITNIEIQARRCYHTGCDSIQQIAADCPSRKSDALEAGLMHFGAKKSGLTLKGQDKIGEERSRRAKKMARRVEVEVEESRLIGPDGVSWKVNSAGELEGKNKKRDGSGGGNSRKDKVPKRHREDRRRES